MRLLSLVLFAMVAACDPQLNMSDGPTSKSTVEGCADAVQHLKTCCPAYDSYLSCTMFSNARNFSGFHDLSERQSRCLSGKSCEQIEHAITGDHSLCDASFRSRRCR